MDYQHAIVEAKLFPIFFYFEVKANVLCSITGDNYNKRTKKKNSVKGFFFNGCSLKLKTTHALKHGKIS